MSTFFNRKNAAKRKQKTSGCCVSQMIAKYTPCFQSKNALFVQRYSINFHSNWLGSAFSLASLTLNTIYNIKKYQIPVQLIQS